MEEDLKLVDEILKGNIDSFNILVNKYEMIILRFIYNMIKDKEASEDITQEVFITVYNKLYTFKKGYKFSNWILQIAKNKCIDYIRKYKRVYQANLEEVRDLATEEISPEESYEFREMKNMIEDFISGLEEVDRQIVNLRYTTESTFHDIAEILNMSESAVKRRYYKLREKFKASISLKEARCKL